MMAARASPLGGGFKRRWMRMTADATLWMRTPARAICGSLRAAIIMMAAGFTVFLLSEAMFLNSKSNPSKGNQWDDESRSKHDYRIIIGIDILAAAANIILIYGTMTAKLHYLYGWMSLGIVDLVLSLAMIFWLSVDIGYSLPLIFVFPLMHFIYQMVLLCLVNGMVHELRGGRFFDNDGSLEGGVYGGIGNGGGGGGGGGGDDGWLQHNLTLGVPPQPGSGPAKPGSPAVLEPSACTTAPSPAPPTPQPIASQC